MTTSKQRLLSAQQQHAPRVYSAVNDEAVYVQSWRQTITLELKIVASRVKVPFVKKRDPFADEIAYRETAMRGGGQVNPYRS